MIQSSAQVSRRSSRVGATIARAVRAAPAFTAVLMFGRVASAAVTINEIACASSHAVLVSDCVRSPDLRCTAQSLRMTTPDGERGEPLAGRVVALRREGEGLDHYVQSWACVTADQRSYVALSYRCAAGFQGCRDDDNREDKDFMQFLGPDGTNISSGDTRSPRYWAAAKRLGLDRASASGISMTSVKLTEH